MEKALKIQGEIIPESTRLLPEIKNVSPFVNPKIIPLFLDYLLDPLTNKYSRVWSSMTNFVERFPDISFPRGNVLGNMTLHIDHVLLESSFC